MRKFETLEEVLKADGEILTEEEIDLLMESPLVTYMECLGNSMYYPGADWYDVMVHVEDDEYTRMNVYCK